MYPTEVDYGPLKELLQARLTAARLEEMAIDAEIKTLEEQLDMLAAMQGVPRSATWDVKAAPSHSVAILSVLLNSRDPMSPGGIWQTIKDAGREPPTQIGFYMNDLYKKGAIRRVAHGQYRPGSLNPKTRHFFPEGYTDDAA
jgi:hypothetical protein